ncbi:alpha/beta-hydrolase [Athelia psychrophila]|uniref:Alpha/beta-hydrolase n=1 Tax=Athelia psychrophila TaxID=1759441 RepID=A0A166JR55_9AGAM|nr:alpha/beta-hydrolase [Fibularhizoctonia sp. CBS 109695]
MGSTGLDWERLSSTLSKNRPVLVFDHRGMGESTYSTADKNDDITTESMARDLVFLVQYLGWKELTICGFSMGGAITQEVLLLPYHPSRPTPLPFRITHVLLTSTLATPLRDRRYGLKIAPFKREPGAAERTIEEEMEIARPLVDATFDPAWVRDHPVRRELWVKNTFVGRQLQTIIKQARAVKNLNFGNLHAQLPADIPVLVIHGKLDAIVPFFCGEEVARLIPHARFVEVGAQPGQIPDLEFGHHWWEYFDEGVWRDVVDVFVGGAAGTAQAVKARL